jgi:hypothetical protein
MTPILEATLQVRVRALENCVKQLVGIATRNALKPSYYLPPKPARVHVVDEVD